MGGSSNAGSPDHRDRSAAAPAALAKAGDEASPAASPAASPVASTSTSLVLNGNRGYRSSNGLERRAPDSSAELGPELPLEEITIRQLSEDIIAYDHDLNFCRAQLEEPDLTPQEARTLQLRTLDLGHQIRYCRNRIEILNIQCRKPAFAHPYASSYAGASARGTGANLIPIKSNGASTGNGKRRTVGSGAGLTSLTPLAKRPLEGADESDTKRAKNRSPSEMEEDVEVIDDVEGPVMALQRLGFWKCRLCLAPKYLLAGAGRSPAAPCKWPLKDISKMITHFTEMHTEHSPAERCSELGAALTMNRGPFEYWIRRTRAHSVGDASVIEECIDSLVGGKMPGLLRRLSRAAAGMPTA
ncbi:hypothetical protein B0T22DRAFT_375014 [Podospora appendiculata]|uniref:Uncharacterized protein n=1 Tax=Podospora appendiculata TaxID=314037 RepID=A0AAE0XC75_9PEZI|nr:hypothetical protein B0T22DRAFT_375014 [Podospora appendiculata]